jgi:endonuclease/exonuclease/phosphatase family metal-dependent hydrolase
MARQRGALTLIPVVSVLLTCASLAHAAAPAPCVPRPVTHASADSDVDGPLGSEASFTVASLNVAGRARITDVLSAWVHDRAVDVLLLQEVGDETDDGAAFIASLGQRLGLGFAYAPATRLENGHAQGLAIVSRYPLDEVSAHPLTQFHLRFRSRCRIALAATVTTPTGPVRLVNVHLDTRINSKHRVAQLRPAIDALDAFDGPRIVGGDFNTMNVRWLRTMWPLPFLQRQSKAVGASLSSLGFHTPFTAAPPTFRFLGLPQKLDWLYLKDLETLESGVDDVPLTDHRGVWARVTPGRRTAGP